MRLTITPACPRCGRLKTGFYIPYTRNETEETMHHFKKGERVRIEPELHYRYNCFCSECGFEWKGTLKTANLNQEEYQEYLASHGFIDDRNRIKKMQEEFNADDSLQKEIKREQRRDIMTGVLWLCGFGSGRRRQKEKEKDNNT